MTEEDDLDEEVNRIIAEMDARAREKEEFGRLVWQEFQRTGGVLLQSKYGRGYAVSLTRSTYPGVRYQVTHWENDEPVGHGDRNSRRTAIDTMWQEAGGDGWRRRWEERQAL